SPHATSLLTGGCFAWAWPTYNSASTPKPPIGYDEASKPIGIFPCRIFNLLVPWRCRGRWIRRIVLFRLALRSIRASLFVASGLTSQATIRPTSLDLSGFARECGWRGCRRSNARDGSNRVDLQCLPSLVCGRRQWMCELASPHLLGESG